MKTLNRLFNKHLLWLLPAVLLAILMISTIVLAEGETPPAPEAPQEASETLPATEETAPLPAADPPAGETVEGSAALPPEPSSEELTSESGDIAVPDVDVIETPAAVPDPSLSEPQVSVLDLTSPESTENLTGNDPWFMVGLTTYRFFNASGVCAVSYSGDPNCHDSQGADVIQDALDYLGNNNLLPTDRKVHVEEGIYNSFTIDSSHPVWPQLNGVIGAGAWQTTLNGDVIISSTLNGFTLLGFKVNGSVLFADNYGLASLQDLNIRSSSYGIMMSPHYGPVVINEVNASDNVWWGLFISSTTGSYPVTITNSSFDRNGIGYSIPQNGVYIYSKNSVSINGVTANFNQGDGIYVNGFSSLTVRNTILHDNKDIHNNWESGFGLYAKTALAAPVILERVYANNNHTGIHIYSDGSLTARYVEAIGNKGPSDYQEGLLFSSIGPARVEFSSFNGNGNDGLDIFTRSNVILNSIHAEGNDLNGAWIKTGLVIGDIGVGTGTLTITSPATGGALQANYFDDNGGFGLLVLSNRAVTINNADFSGNGVDGLKIDTCSHSLSGCVLTGNVTLGVTIPNWLNGASLNSNNGIIIDSGGAVSISMTSSSQSLYAGMDITAYGQVKLSGVNASDNGSHGAYIENDESAAPASVLLTDCAFNDNHNGDGLQVLSKGAVAAAGLTASNNSQGGVLLDNTYGSAGVSILPSGKSYATVFDGNGSYGLLILSNGSIMVNGISANGNGDNGLDLNNATSMPATIQNTRTDGFVSTFDGNGWDGVSVFAWGSITLKNISASGNAQSGADLDNCIYNPGLNACTASGNITVNASAGVMNEFSNNGDFGLRASSRGAIKIVNVGAYENHNSGVRLQNNYTNSAAGVIVAASGNMRNVFNHNNLNTLPNTAGLWIESHGTITLSKVTAHNNPFPARGIYLLNRYAAFPKTILASDLNIAGSGVSGLYVDGSGVITITGIQSNLNGSIGAYLTNNGNIGKITITSNAALPLNSFENNGMGLFIEKTAGLVYLQDIRARGNATDGAYIINSDGMGSVTVKSVFSGSRFGSNSYRGLVINTKGAVSILGGKYGIAANNNGLGATPVSDGIYIYNTTAPALRAVILQNVTANDNHYGSGLYILANGPITLTSVHADGNQNGILAYNDWESAPIRMLGTNSSSGNTGWGTELLSNGSITVSGLTAEDNGHDGLKATTNGSGAITVNSSLFRHNSQYGLSLFGYGDFILNNVLSFNNGSSGNWDGLHINAYAASSNVTIRYSAFQDNKGNGIEIVHPLFPAWMPTLISSSWFGNDYDKSGDPNLYVHN